VWRRIKAFPAGWIMLLKLSSVIHELCPRLKSSRVRTRFECQVPAEISRHVSGAVNLSQSVLRKRRLWAVSVWKSACAIPKPNDIFFDSNDTVCVYEMLWESRVERYPLRRTRACCPRVPHKTNGK
jgi:hypothetical protein